MGRWIRTFLVAGGFLCGLAPLGWAQTRVETPNRTTTGTFDGVNDTISVAMSGLSGLSVHIGAGLTADVRIDTSFDNGATWATMSAVLIEHSLGAITKTYVAKALTGSVVDFAAIVLPGATHARVFVSAYSSGSATAIITATASVSSTTFVTQHNLDSLYVGGPATHGGVLPGNEQPLFMGAFASATAPADVTASRMTHLWAGRNGSLATFLTAAGALIGGDATNGLDVDVTRFPDNEPFNVAQINGVTPLMNSGDAGTGAQRVVTAQNLVASANNDGACVSVTTASTAVLASFATRKWASIVNQGTATVYVKFGATATSSDFPLPAGAAFNWPSGLAYTGAVDGISSSGTNSVCIVEW